MEDKIKDRITIRLNEAEKLQIKELGLFINENDLSKIVKAGFKITLWYLKFVNNDLSPPEYEVLFTQKRKTNPIGRRVY